MSDHDIKHGQQPGSSSGQSHGPSLRPSTAPGKRTQTASLPPRSASVPAPVQAKRDPAAPAAHAEQAASTEQWMHVVMRPDLCQEPVQRKAASQEPASGPSGLASSGSGKPLPDGVRGKMEGAFDTDFSAVRVQEGPQAPAMGALAFTQGTNIQFAPGQYQPDSQRGQELLGHELAHVVQQSQGQVQATMQAKGVAINDDSSLERQADEMGARAARGEAVSSAVQARQHSGAVQARQHSGAVQARQHSETAPDTVPGTTPIQRQPAADGPSRMHVLQPVAGGSAVVQRAKKRDRSTLDADSTDTVTTDPNADTVEELDSDQRYWARAVVRSVADGAEHDASEISVLSVSISPERRTTKLGPEQGDHIVAWSAMVRYWGSQLQGPLPGVLDKLKDWLLADQTADQDTQGSNKDKRAQALYLIDELATKKHTANIVLSYLERAVSLFVEANQYSSFAVHGKASGGQDEGRAQQDLAALNEKAAAGPLSAEDKTQLEARALALIDVAGKQLEDAVLEKGVHTWLTMLKGSYPHLERYLDDILGQHQFSGQKAEDLSKAWTDKHAAGRDASKNTLEEARTDDPMLESRATEGIEDAATGVLVNVAETTPTSAPLAASEVKVRHLELPAKMRARTRYGATQGSHTLAYTYERTSLMNLFKGKTADKILADIDGLAKRDKDSLNLAGSYLESSVSPGELADMAERANRLCDLITMLAAATLPLNDWIERLNYLAVEYIELNQSLPTTTYKYGGQAYSHGEPSANKAFQEAQTGAAPYNFDDLLTYAAKYVDIGIFYVPMVREATRYSTNTRRIKLDGKADPLQRLQDGDTVSDLTNEMDTAIAAKNAEAPSGAGVDVATLFETLATQPRMTPKFVKETLAPCSYEQLVGIGALASEILHLQERNTGELNPAKRIKASDEADNMIAKLGGLDNLDTKRLSKIKTEAENREPHHPGGVAQRLTEQRDLMNSLHDPGAYLEALYGREKPILSKVLGDFYSHLPHFYQRFYDDLKGNEAKKKELFIEIMSEPLNVTDVVIGEPLTIQLGNHHKTFVAALEAKLEEKAGDWSKEVFIDPA